MFPLPFNKGLYFLSMAHIKVTLSHLANWKLQHRLVWMSNATDMFNLQHFLLPLLRQQAFVCINELPNDVGFGPHRVTQVLVNGRLPHSIGNFYTAQLPGKAELAKRQLEVRTFHQMCSSSKSILGVTSIYSGARKVTEPSPPHVLEIGLLMVCNEQNKKPYGSCCP